LILYRASPSRRHHHCVPHHANTHLFTSPLHPSSFTARYYDLAKAVAAKWGLSATDPDRPGRRPGTAATLYERHRYRWPSVAVLMGDVEATIQVNRA
jgi:hypothetical protein